VRGFHDQREAEDRRKKERKNTNKIFKFYPKIGYKFNYQKLLGFFTNSEIFTVGSAS